MSAFRFGIIQFPGSNCDVDAHRALAEVFEQHVRYVWYTETRLDDLDALILPGGFSYGDALRPGALASLAPVMEAVRGFAAAGRPVLGICNGFQILCEAGLLPGALLRNRDLRFHCHDVYLRVERDDTPFTLACQRGQVLRMPIAHGEGRYVAPPDVLDRLEREGRVLFRYVDAHGHATETANPNGSDHNIAGICNETGNVVGMMPHPERCVEALLGGTDGRCVFSSLLRWLGERSASGVR